MKFSSLHIIPWCLHVMGSHIPCVHLRHNHPIETVKLIRSDGMVNIYHRPINASELMTEFPKHLICHSDSFFIGKKIPALSENDKLKLGNKYFLLPKPLFQSVLSFVTIASFASSSPPTKNALLKKTATCRPFDIHKTKSGTLQIRVSDEFISKLIEAGKMKEDGEEDEEDKMNKKNNRVCTTPELKKDYTRLVECRTKLWKPALETIRESGKKKLGSFGIKRRKKSQSKGTQKTKTKTKKLEASPSKIKGKKGLR